MVLLRVAGLPAKAGSRYAGQVLMGACRYLQTSAFGDAMLVVPPSASYLRSLTVRSPACITLPSLIHRLVSGIEKGTGGTC